MLFTPNNTKLILQINQGTDAKQVALEVPKRPQTKISSPTYTHGFYPEGLVLGVMFRIGKTAVEDFYNLKDPNHYLMLERLSQQRTIPVVDQDGEAAGEIIQGSMKRSSLAYILEEAQKRPLVSSHNFETAVEKFLTDGV